MPKSRLRPNRKIELKGLNHAGKATDKDFARINKVYSEKLEEYDNIDLRLLQEMLEPEWEEKGNKPLKGSYLKACVETVKRKREQASKLISV